MTAGEQMLFTPPNYAVLVPSREQALSEIVAETFSSANGQPLDQAGIEQVSAAITKRNPDVQEVVIPGSVLILPVSVGASFFFKRTAPKNDTPPKPPAQPPRQIDDSDPPDSTVPTNPIWDWEHHDTLWTGPQINEPDGCKGHFENVVEKNGTQEARSRAGSFVFVRLKETEGKSILGVPIKHEYAEVVRAARYAVRTWQLQRTAQYFVEICPPDNKVRRVKHTVNKPVWVQLHPDEYVAGPPEEVIAVETGDVGPVAGSGAPLTSTPKDKADKLAKDYAHDHPGVIYAPELNGKEIK